MGATAQRPQTLLAVVVAGVLAFVVGLPVGVLLLLGGSDSCGAGVAAPQPSGAAQQGIPSDYLKLYQAAGKRYGLPWTLLAGIGSVETDHGRLKAPGVSSGANFAGAGGPMQFLAPTFAQYGTDGNGDGRKSRYQPADAIASAARYLRASGAPKDLNRAIFAYNHAGWYVQKVQAKMRQYDQAGAAGLAAPAAGGAAAGDCADLGGLGGLGGSGEGKYTLTAGAFGLTPQIKAVVSRMAGVYTGGTLSINSGRRPGAITTSGNVSDHATGNAADFGMVNNGGTNDGPVGDRIAASALIVAGLPKQEAVTRARGGGLHSVVTGDYRIQVIWKYVGHHDHVHVGIARVR